MPQCRVRQGFYVLRDCPRQAPSVCGKCERPVCDAHFVSAVEMCADCYGSQNDALDATDEQYAYQERLRLYGGRKHRPVYWGHYYNDEYYDDFEMRDFEGAAEYAEGDMMAGDAQLEAGDYYDS